VVTIILFHKLCYDLIIKTVMSDKNSKDLLHRYVKELMLELKISRRGRKSLSVIKGVLGDLWGGKSKNSSSRANTAMISRDEESDVATELNKWFKQVQSVGKKKISSDKTQEIKKFATETYKKLLDKGEDESIASLKTIRAVDKKYAADV